MPSSTRALIRRLSPIPDLIPDEWAANAPEFLPIVPSARLWLPRLGIGDDERFAILVQDTWRRIPLGARRLMVRHWRRSEPIWAIQGLWSPTIQLTEYWELSDQSVRQPKDLAGCGRNGHSLYFYAPLVDAMPAQHVQELIAHELAHVVQYAIGEPPHSDRTLPRWCDQTEIIADEIMELWDFDPWAMDKWVERHWTWPTDQHEAVRSGSGREAKLRKKRGRR